MVNLLMSFPNTLDSATFLKYLTDIFTLWFCRPFWWQNEYYFSLHFTARPKPSH